MHIIETTVNDSGLQFIADRLTSLHQRGHLMTVSNIRAWASDVEASFCEGQRPQFEIPASVARSGTTEIVYLDDTHLDVRLVEVNDDNCGI